MNIRTTVTTGILFGMLQAAATQGYAADWQLSFQLKAGAAVTSVTVGTTAAATDGYDAAYDVPAPSDAETLDAYLAHPGWGVVIGGKTAANFHQDIRSATAQTFEITVKSLTSPVAVTWDSSALPAQARLMLVDATNGSLLDMKALKSYSLPVKTSAKLVVVVEQPDTVPPATPLGLTAAPGSRTGSMQVTWAANTETDVAGYRLRIGAAPGQWERSVDLKNVLNYNLFGLVQGESRYVALSAYDASGNESEVSAFLEVQLPQPVINGVCGASAGETFTAMPTTGYCAAGTSTPVSGAGHPWSWSCTGTGSGAAASSCQAWLKTWSVTFSAVSGGSIVGPTSQVVDYGASSTAVTAVADQGYQFSGWSGATSGMINPLLLAGVTADMAVTASFTALPVGTVAADGDVDGDGKTSVRDALMAIRNVIGSYTLSSEQIKHADVFPVGNPDGVLTIHDGIVILRKALGLIK